MKQKNNYPTKKLGDKDILFMSSGGTPSRGKLEYYRGDIMWLKSGELKDSQHINNSEEKISEKALNNSSAKIFPKNTVLFAMYGATAGKLGILDVPATTNQAVAGMICNEKILYYKYLFYFLLNTREKIIDKAWGGAQPNLSQTIIKKIEIPLPPLEIQKKIVERIEKLMAKIDEAKKLKKEAVTDASSLIPSALNKIFEEGKKNGWEEKTIAGISEKTKRINPKDFFNKYFSYIDITSVSKSFNRVVRARSMLVGNAPSRARNLVKEKDIIFATTRPYLKNIIMIPKSLSGSVASTGFCIIRSNKKIVDPNYVYYAVDSDYFLSKIIPLQRGATYPAVSDTDIYNQKIPLPPLPEQQKIVKYLDSLSEKVRKIQALQSETERELKLLEKSVLNEAFVV